MIMKHILSSSTIILALFLTLLSSANASVSKFMQGEFDEIHRYDFLVFENSEISEDSKKNLNQIIEKIDALKKSAKEFEITLVGHTQKLSRDENEQRIRSNTYITSIQKLFEDSDDKNRSIDTSKKYVQTIYEALVDKNISKELINVDYAGDTYALYTSATSEGKKLSNGVFVSLYVYKEPEIDSDKDGILDQFDKCPSTPRGAKVDAYGCPLDSDGDGVLDYKDECSNTPTGVEVDKKGCPIDSDGDGIPDYKDECGDTPTGVNVGADGCAVKSTLKITFKTASDKISADSYSEIKRFADFLNENPRYNALVVGHTDSVGKATLNMKLSEQRAEMTKKALINEGVDASRLSAKGRGEIDPIASNVTAEGRATNRRIEVELILNDR